ncbi:DUF418 domain-containing protein [Agromyces sp. SYSU T00194]|uniref:DUF418 domain-containing protein n=1 Tax=Agromyces chitinivorans TaxID=3158560 RepID=UPI00339964BB
MTGPDVRTRTSAERFRLGRRIVGVDAARGLALVGMFVAHLAPDPPEGTVGAVALSLADERPRLLFALTAGIGLGLLTGGAVPAGADQRAELRRQVAVRAVLLLLLGLALATFLRPLASVILDEYGIAFLLLLPLLFLPRGVLLGIGAGLLALAPGAAVALAATDAVGDARGGAWRLVVDWFVAGAYPVPVWVGVMLIGVAIARADLLRPATASAMALAGSAAAVTCVPAAAWVRDVGAPADAAVAESLAAIGNVGVGLVVTAALVGATQWGGERMRRASRITLAPFTAMGAMPLTVYTAHIVVVSQAIRVEDGALADDSWPLLVLTVAGSMLFALAWGRWVGRGPLEALFRLLSGRDRTA